VDDLHDLDHRKALVRGWFAMFNTGRLDAADDIAADLYVEHAIAPFGEVEPGAVQGPTHLRETADWLLAQFPDLSMTIEELIAEGDLIAALITATGTNEGPLDGRIERTGRRFSAHQTHWFRVRGGHLAEHWATRDDLRIMMQLGTAPRPRPSRGPMDARADLLARSSRAVSK
jgi:predicted ester cyclase